MKTDNILTVDAGDNRFIIVKKRCSAGTGRERQKNYYYLIKSRPGKRNLKLRISRTDLDSINAADSEKKQAGLCMALLNESFEQHDPRLAIGGYGYARHPSSSGA
ncbi:hypothetical protein [Thiothrix sp.]|jgi:hypothetical protein|uniref:hypothetical protein n=1 Tax=Thiothrix sp. TaxID=1032 RepID=UPI00257D82B1|nr:hypothetical protein [Thiothrix sp.]